MRIPWALPKEEGAAILLAPLLAYGVRAQWIYSNPSAVGLEAVSVQSFARIHSAGENMGE